MSTANSFDAFPPPGRPELAPLVGHDRPAQILADVLGLMTQLADDWEYGGALRPETRLLHDLGLESLDLVVLGTSLQERYGVLPFSEFLAELGERPPEERDVRVQDLVGFVCRHAGTPTAGGQP